MQIEPIPQENLAQALALAERVFMQVEPPDYPPEGMHTFRMTANSSPYAVEIYQKLGFHALSEEQKRDGIRFTPMKYTREREAVLC